MHRRRSLLQAYIMSLMSARYHQAELAPNTCSSSVVDVHMYVLPYPSIPWQVLTHSTGHYLLRPFIIHFDSAAAS